MVAKKTAKESKKPVKKGTPKKAAPAKNTMGPAKKTFSKTEIVKAITEATELSKKQVESVFTTLTFIIESHMKKSAIGSFILPGLLKIYVVKKPATKARKGVNPFTGQPTTFKAKPARLVVKIKALKKLKDMVV